MIMAECHLAHNSTLAQVAEARRSDSVHCQHRNFQKRNRKVGDRTSGQASVPLGGNVVTLGEHCLRARLNDIVSAAILIADRHALCTHSTEGGGRVHSAKVLHKPVRPVFLWTVEWTSKWGGNVFGSGYEKGKFS